MSVGIDSQLHHNMQDFCSEVGIGILSPHFKAGRFGNLTRVPPKYLSKDYKATSFNVKIKKREVK